VDRGRSENDRSDLNFDRLDSIRRAALLPAPAAPDRAMPASPNEMPPSSLADPPHGANDRRSLAPVGLTSPHQLNAPLLDCQTAPVGDPLFIAIQRIGDLLPCARRLGKAFGRVATFEKSVMYALGQCRQIPLPSR